MRIQAILAETGRQGAPGVSLLNAGLTVLQAQVLPDQFEGWTLPQHAVALFIDIEPAKVEHADQALFLELELVASDGDSAYIMPGPKVSPESGPLKITQQLVLQPLPGAPVGAPGLLPMIVDFSGGSVWLPAVSRKYTWRITLGQCEQSVSFWVSEPTQVPEQPSALSFGTAN